MQDLEAERSRLEQNASESQDEFAEAKKRDDQAFKDLVEFESKNLREEQAEWLGGR